METDKPYFSIITPTYNRAHCLPQMVASVQAQTFSQFEHIIVDDGSNDDTERLLNQINSSDYRVAIIKQKNHGRSHARNVGINAARGTYLCFLDSDDAWNADYLMHLHDAIQQSGATFLATKMVWVNGVSGQRTERQIEDVSFKNLHRIIELELGMNSCVRRSYFTDNRFDSNLSINEDFELWLRIICSNSIHVKAVPKSIYYVTTPEIVGLTSIGLLKEIEITQRIIRSNSCVNQTIPKSFWETRKKSILLRKIRAYESIGQYWNMSINTILFVFEFPNEKVNSSLLVSVLYRIPGGGFLKRLVALLKKMHSQQP